MSRRKKMICRLPGCLRLPRLIQKQGGRYFRQAPRWCGVWAFYTANTNVRCKCTLLHKPECRKHQKSCLPCACRNSGKVLQSTLQAQRLPHLKGCGQTLQPACTFGLGQVPLPTQAPTTATQQPQLLLQLKLHPDLPQLESLSWQQPTQQKHCQGYFSKSAG
jgi:hypothetical protein